MIVRYRCDVPMADKKGILRFCNKKCKECICAIAIDEWGRYEHVSMPDGGTCSNVTLRNINHLNGQDRTGRKGRPISHRGKEL